MAEKSDDERMFKPSDLVRLKTGVRLLVVTGYADDGEVVYMMETDTSVMQGTAPECALELLKREEQSPAVVPAAAEKPKKKPRRKLREPVAGSFAAQVCAGVQDGSTPEEIAALTGKSPVIVRMWIARLKKDGWLPKS